MNQENVVFCPQCGASNPSVAKFCGKCGYSFQSRDAGAQIAPAPDSLIQPPPLFGSSEPGFPPMPGATPVAPPTPSWPQPGQAPVPPVPQNRPGLGAVSAFDVRADKLGQNLDGWDDTIENAGDKADEIRKAFARELTDRSIPNVKIEATVLSTGGVAGKRRPYYLLRDYAGATLAVYISPFGRDLYVAWDLFTRRTIKWRNIAIMAGLTIMLTWISTLFSAVLSATLFDFFWSESLSSSPGEVFTAIGLFVISVVIWGVLLGAGALFIGKEYEGNSFAYLIKNVGNYQLEPNWKNIGIIVALSFAFSMFSGLLSFVTLLNIVLGALILGRILRGQWTAFFFEQLDHFTYDDRRALRHTVHKSLLKAIDTAGLNSSLLRKREFYNQTKQTTQNK